MPLSLSITNQLVLIKTILFSVKTQGILKNM